MRPVRHGAALRHALPWDGPLLDAAADCHDLVDLFLYPPGPVGSTLPWNPFTFASLLDARGF